MTPSVSSESALHVFTAVLSTGIQVEELATSETMFFSRQRSNGFLFAGHEYRGT